jgi:hypothetical protein
VLEITEVEHGSDRYLDLVNLRRRVLRAPLGLDFTAQQLADERTDVHLAAYLDGELAGCAILTPIDRSQGVIKLRQMAIDPDRRAQGLGARIVAFAEQLCAARGYTQIILSARETAVGFYEKAGFVSKGAPFVEVTLPHREMTKELQT